MINQEIQDLDIVQNQKGIVAIKYQNKFYGTFGFINKNRESLVKNILFMSNEIRNFQFDKKIGDIFSYCRKLPDQIKEISIPRNKYNE
jgi:hypothetical protein